MVGTLFFKLFLDNARAAEDDHQALKRGDDLGKTKVAFNCHFSPPSRVSSAWAAAVGCQNFLCGTTYLPVQLNVRRVYSPGAAVRTKVCVGHSCLIPGRLPSSLRREAHTLRLGHPEHSPWHNSAAWCVHGLASSGRFTQVESHHLWPVSGLVS